MTDAWRPADALPSLHARCLAFDYRCKNISAFTEEAREDRGHAWAVRMRAGASATTTTWSRMACSMRFTFTRSSIRDRSL